MLLQLTGGLWFHLIRQECGLNWECFEGDMMIVVSSWCGFSLMFNSHSAIFGVGDLGREFSG